MVYTTVLIGKNKLSEMVKTMAQGSKLAKPVTIHSLRAYVVTKMFASNVPEKLIMERSGHRSIIDYLNYATGIGIHPRTPVTMCVVFFRFSGDAISGYTYSVVRLFTS